MFDKDDDEPGDNLDKTPVNLKNNNQAKKSNSSDNYSEDNT